MKRAFGVLLVIALFLFPLNAFAVVKAGTACTKLGATSTIAGKKYTCIKSGKKLIWDKGVAMIKPLPTITPTPTPRPEVTPTPTSTPTPTPIPVVLPTSFAELYGNFEGVGIAAWNSANEKIKKSAAVPVRQDIYTGPNTKVPNSNVKEIFENATRLFAGCNQPQSCFAVY